MSTKISAITIPLVVLLYFSGPVWPEQNAVRWKDLSRHLAKKSVPLSRFNVTDCPRGIENSEPNRVVAQIIENTFYLWDEYDITTDGGAKTSCIVMKKPNPGPLSKKETQTLLTASGLWKESLPGPEDAIILDASDPSLNLRPIEDRYVDTYRKMLIQPENLIDSDDRVRITNTTSDPWKYHCFVSFYFGSMGWRGTGCLVSPYMVLTCGHNVYDRDLGIYINGAVTAPGQKQEYERGQVIRPYGDREGVEFVTSADYITSSDTEAWKYDYGAIFFCAPFSDISTYIPVEFAASLPVGQTVHLAGYPGEVQEESESRALWNDSGPVHSYTTSEELRYELDTTFGQSGSPVLRDYTGGKRVVAVHAFGSESANGGPRLRSYNQALIQGWMQHIPDCPRPCEDCEPEDVDLGTITTVTWGGSVSGNCGNGGKWVGQFVGQADAIYHFDLCPDSPGDGTNSGEPDPDIKITNGSCIILAGEDGECSSPSWSPNDFQWICPADGTYYVIIAPYNSSESHTCNGSANNSFTLEYYKELQCSINVTSPDSSWRELGDILPVTWNSANTSGSVKIELYKADSLERVLEEDWLDDGSYSWSIPIDGSLIGGGDYRIKVTDVSDPLCYNYSVYFGIAAPPVARDSTVITPVDVPAAITLAAIDEGRPDPPAALTYTITSLPIHGNLNDPCAGPIIDPCTPLVNNGNQVSYTPEAGYMGQDSFTFVANDGGIAPAGGNSNTAAVAIEVLNCADITIGTGTSTWDCPMHTYYEDSRTQVIYLSSEIGDRGAITALALDVETIPGQMMNNWTIRMKHTDMTSYNIASLDATGWTVVYEGNEPPGETGWRTFEFSNAFDYNYINNLMVDFSHDNNSYAADGLCMCSTSGSRRSSYAFSDSHDGDPLDWSGTSSPAVYGTDKVPNIRLTICADYELEPILVELNLDHQWMYQNLPVPADSNITASISITDDPMGNVSYTYAWELILPADVSTSPINFAGGGAIDTLWTLAARSCNYPEGLSDSGLPFKVKVTVTGDDYGNTGSAEAQFGIALLGDVNNDCFVDVADRSIANAFWRLGSVGDFTLRDCDVNCDGVVDVADRSITNAVWRGVLGESSVAGACPFR